MGRLKQMLLLLAFILSKSTWGLRLRPGLRFGATKFATRLARWVLWAEAEGFSRKAFGLEGLAVGRGSSLARQALEILKFLTSM